MLRRGLRSGHHPTPPPSHAEGAEGALRVGVRAPERLLVVRTAEAVRNKNHRVAAGGFSFFLSLPMIVLFHNTNKILSCALARARDSAFCFFRPWCLTINAR